MAKALYTSGNFIIADDDGNIKPLSTSNSSYKEENESFVMIDDVTRTRVIIPFSEVGDWSDAESGGSPYTEETLRTFVRANFSTASGGSGAATFTNPEGGFEISNEPTTLGGQSVPQATCKVQNGDILYSIGAQDITNLGGGYQAVMSAVDVTDFSGANVTLTESRISLQVNNAGGSPNIRVELTNGNLKITGLPTSAVGLESGDVWNNMGILTIVN